jgi:uncharacterized protein
MRNAIILHGTDASPSSNWFPWLKSELSIIGYDVWVPELPNWSAPNRANFMRVIAAKNFLFNEETIIVGHSSGAVAALHLLPLTGSTIRAAFFVSAFKDTLGWPSLNGLFDREFDFAAIKQAANERIFYYSDDDPYVTPDHAEFLASATEGELVPMRGMGHFNVEKSPDFVEFHALLGRIKQL